MIMKRAGGGRVVGRRYSAAGYAEQSESIIVEP
jgi:hypothetical protein